MNRYTITGALDDMRNGRRVLVLCHTQHEARHAFTSMARHALPSETVRRANGQERITAHDGPGWIAFSSARGNAFRGMSVDVVVLDHDPSLGLVATIKAALAASKVGEIIRP
ncbi:hypothetical protein [Micromonospora endolithica]|uniref:Uncharacterized protein n=1 Tax=Micromonospora endolithica TaxID=230091 RepID=A0A3A9YR33_9ACTN|nr:hypothetical protein [Micromonospora endolithica]RKN38462.1 hypothetical protein D7223_31145 [Micromonospora endolithica]TWJ23116.1 hypothetical protein JD76_03245 [Micromonospora endolithica]